MNIPEIFVSYAWKGESEALVDRLCQTFASIGYRIIRDKSDMTYKDSIREFMDRIGQGKFVIAVIGDKYMKSEYCMYEAYHMFQSRFFRERVFPIVLPDADIFSFRRQAAYLKFWDTEYKRLEKEYRKIADVSPAMVASLTERLQKIKAMTLFINDFMTQIADMNVLTSQIHLESNFSQLISTIEESMKQIESESRRNAVDQSGKVIAPPKEISDHKLEVDLSRDQRINTSLDYMGQNKRVGGNETNIKIGGSVSGSNIIVGNNNMVTNSTSKHIIFAPVYHAIEKTSLSAQDKVDLMAEVQEIEATVNRNTPVDETWLACRIRNLKRIAPDIANIVLSVLIDPSVVVGPFIKKMADRIKAEE